MDTGYDPQLGPRCALSFIVPAYNEARLIDATLGAIRLAGAASGESFEIIVVDDASTDSTAAIAADYGARVLHVNNRQISRTRNDGANSARGEFLFFVDADTLIDAAVLRAALAALRDGNVGGGAVFRFDDAVRTSGRVIELSVATVLRWLHLASGCFVFARRDAFEAVGGFPSDLFAAEEWALSRALGRIGRFRVLREHVVTSGRKLKTVALRDVLKTGWTGLWRGKRALRERDLLGIWYGKR